MDAVVFDLDGTLIDSIHVHFKVLNTAFERVGLPAVSMEDVLNAAKEGQFDWQGVLPGKDRAREKWLLTKSIEIIADIQSEMLRQEVRLIHGTVEILKALTEEGLRIGLVTNTQRIYLDDKLYLLNKAGVARLFEVIITTDDVPGRKPSPEPLIECGKRLGVSPERIVYVGDSRVDIRAGKAAGTKTIGVLTGMDGYDVLAAERPDAIIESVLYLKERILPA